MFLWNAILLIPFKSSWCFWLSTIDLLFQEVTIKPQVTGLMHATMAAVKKPDPTLRIRISNKVRHSNSRHHLSSTNSHSRRLAKHSLDTEVPQVLRQDRRMVVIQSFKVHNTQVHHPLYNSHPNPQARMEHHQVLLHSLLNQLDLTEAHPLLNFLPHNLSILWASLRKTPP